MTPKMRLFFANVVDLLLISTCSCQNDKKASHASYWNQTSLNFNKVKQTFFDEFKLSKLYLFSIISKGICSKFEVGIPRG